MTGMFHGPTHGFKCPVATSGHNQGVPCAVILISKVPNPNP